MLKAIHFLHTHSIIYIFKILLKFWGWLPISFLGLWVNMDQTQSCNIKYNQNEVKHLLKIHQIHIDVEFLYTKKQYKWIFILSDEVGYIRSHETKKIMFVKRWMSYNMEGT